jgi:hypothetical protein
MPEKFSMAIGASMVPELMMVWVPALPEAAKVRSIAMLADVIVRLLLIV